MDLMSFWR